jgi:hypothetical protein
LTTTLGSYAPLSTPSFTGVLTSSGLIQANGGITIPSTQTLTISGATNCTTQAIYNNTNSLATTAYVDRLLNYSIYTHTTNGQTYPLPAYTQMKVIWIGKYDTSAGTLTVTNPSSAYIGQQLTFINAGPQGSGYAQMNIKFATGTYVTGFRGDNWRQGENGLTYVTYATNLNTNCLTFTFLNQTALGMTWYMSASTI